MVKLLNFMFKRSYFEECAVLGTGIGSLIS